MRRIAVALAFALSAAVFLVGGAGSATSKSAFEVFVVETTSAASNGLTLHSAVEGSFDIAAKTASGEGVYEVFAGTTEIEHGTFRLTGLVAFQFYGCGEVTTPDGPLALLPDFCGGGPGSARSE